MTASCDYDTLLLRARRDVDAYLAEYGDPAPRTGLRWCVVAQASSATDHRRRTQASPYFFGSFHVKPHMADKMFMYRLDDFTWLFCSVNLI
jgi:hypothetical protein